MIGEPFLRSPARLRGASFGLLVALWMAAAVSVFSIASELPNRVTRWDFSQYYLSAISQRLHKNPYATDFSRLGAALGLETGEINRASYPPTFLFLIEPISYLPERAAYWTWQGLNAALFIGSLLLLFGEGGFAPNVALALTALAIFYPPVAYHFYLGQTEIPILFLLALMMRLMERGLDAGAGLCLAFASLIKLFPLLLVVYLLMQRRWRVVRWTLIGFTVGVVSALCWQGLSTFLSYASAVDFVMRQQWLGSAWNISTYAFASRLVWLLAGGSLVGSADWIRRAVSLCSDGVLFFCTVAATRVSRPGEDRHWRAFSLWTVTSVMLSPTAWVHYMVLFLVFFAQLLSAAISRQASHRALALAMASYLLLLPAMRPLFLATLPAIDSHFGTLWADKYVRMIGSMQFLSALAAYLAAYRFAKDDGY